MQLTNDTARYGAIGQWLHWTTAILVVALLAMGNAFDMEADEPGSALFFWHSSLGILVFLVALVRIVWLLFDRPPAFPQSTSRLFRVLARSTHVALYVLLFALPVTGWLAASSEGAPVSFFGVATVPEWQWAGAVRAQSLPLAGQSKPSTAKIAEQGEAGAEESEGRFTEIHEVLGNVLLILASLHVLAALKHHFVDHDDVLRRMLPRARRSGTTPPSAHEHELT